jgi:hypothetical protein
MGGVQSFEDVQNEEDETGSVELPLVILVQIVVVAVVVLRLLLYLLFNIINITLVIFVFLLVFGLPSGKADCNGNQHAIANH